jgi:hypothetical protein
MTSIEMRDSLLGIECRCGERKLGGMSFCRDCWMRLPRAMGRALYKLIGDGYEAAYIAACKYLDDDDRPPLVLGRVFGKTS